MKYNLEYKGFTITNQVDSRHPEETRVLKDGVVLINLFGAGDETLYEAMEYINNRIERTRPRLSLVVGGRA